MFRESLASGVIFAPFEGPETPDSRKRKRQGVPRGEETQNRVLIVGRQHELALYRAEFLRQAGFTVLIAADVNEAIRIMQRGAFDAVVLSYTLLSEDLKYLADAARDYSADSAVIVVCNSVSVHRRLEADAIALAEWPVDCHRL